MDPLAEKAPDWTPYRFCFNNPVRYTDPDGMLEDDYGLSPDGTISLIRKTDDDFDNLIVVNSNGEETDKSTKVQKGVLDNISCDEVVDSQNSTSVPSQVIDVSNMTDDAARNLFEFIADNSDSEFSYSIFSNSKSYISTTFMNSPNNRKRC